MKIDMVGITKALSEFVGNELRESDRTEFC